MDFRNFKPCLLLAMPELKDPNFAKSVLLLSDYDENGALGIVLNRETHLTLGEALHFSKGNLVESYKSYPLYAGGPVDPQRIWVLFPKTVYPKIKGEVLGDGVVLAEEGQMLIDDAMHLAQNDIKVLHGYARWEAKQLDTEIAQSFWITTKISRTLIFDTPVDEMWNKAMQELGIDPNHLQGGPNSQILN